MFKYLFSTAMKNQNIMINCKRKRSNGKKRLPYHCFVKFNEYQNLLVNELCIKRSAAGKILCRHRGMFNVPKDHLAKQCRWCREYKIDVQSLYDNPLLLSWSKQTLENRVTLLHELGVERLHASMVSNFPRLMSIPVRLFKACAGIPKATSLAGKLLRVMGETPPAGAPPLRLPSEDSSVGSLHSHIVQWYFQWKLNIPEDDAEQMKSLQSNSRMKSIGMMREMFDILHYDVGLTIQEIVKHRCMGTGSPADLRQILHEIKSFYGIDVKKLIATKPILHKMEYENVKQVLEFLEEREFGERAIRRYPEILLVPKHEIVEKMGKMKEIPELDVLKHSSKALNLVLKFKKANIRMRYLRYLNIKNATVRALTSKIYRFERFVKTGTDLTKGKEIGDAFEKILRLQSREIQLRLRKHPYWNHIDLVTMHETIQFLLERFKPNDLHDNVHLILYPREKIAEVMDKLLESTKTLEKRKKKSRLPKHLLALCLYEIEREHHFSGDGVWRKEAPLPKPLSPTRNIDRESLSDDSDGENLEPADVGRTVSWRCK